MLERRQVVAGRLSDVFSFFKDPRNLEAITPPWLRFRVHSSTTETVERGTEIDYRLRWHVVPMRWRSRISEYEENRTFVDEMLRGPYAFWRHRHDFAEVATGIEIVDVVEYRLPFGLIGRLAHASVVRSQLEAIFDFRQEATRRILLERLCRSGTT